VKRGNQKSIQKPSALLERHEQKGGGSDLIGLGASTKKKKTAKKGGIEIAKKLHSWINGLHYSILHMASQGGEKSDITVEIGKKTGATQGIPGKRENQQKKEREGEKKREWTINFRGIKTYTLLGPIGGRERRKKKMGGRRCGGPGTQDIKD